MAYNVEHIPRGVAGDFNMLESLSDKNRKDWTL
jgi:hypothetical protein